MQSKLVLLASATGALAAVRDLSGSLPQNYARALSAVAARADDGTPECLSVAASHTTITDDFPLPPTQLATATDLGAVPTITDPCVFPTITGSLGPVVTSWSSALQSWQDRHITELRSVYSACTDVPVFSELVAEFGDAICSTALAPFTSELPTAVSTATEVVSATRASTETEASSTATVTVATSASGTDAEETTAAASTDAAASDAEATTNTSFNAAPRETGMVMAAAAAAAGIVGAVML